MGGVSPLQNSSPLQNISEALEGGPELGQQSEQSKVGSYGQSQDPIGSALQGLGQDPLGGIEQQLGKELLQALEQQAAQSQGNNGGIGGQGNGGQRAANIGADIGSQNGGGQLGAQLGATDARQLRQEGFNSQEAGQLGGAKGQYTAAVNQLEKDGVQLDSKGNIDTNSLKNALDPNLRQDIQNFYQARTNLENTDAQQRELSGEGAAQAQKDAGSDENALWKQNTQVSS